MEKKKKARERDRNIIVQLTYRLTKVNQKDTYTRYTTNHTKTLYDLLRA